MEFFSNLDFFWWMCLVGGVAAIIILIWGLRIRHNDLKRWNKGKCTECGTTLFLDRCDIGGNPIYKCPKCGHEVDIWWTRTI